MQNRARCVNANLASNINDPLIMRATLQWMRPLARTIRVGTPQDGFHVLLGFVTAHPASDVDAALARFILSERVRDHGAIFDVHEGHERIALAALIERGDGSELILLGALPDRLDRRALTALFASAEERAAATGAVDVPLLADRRAWEPLLRARRWHEAYRLLTMERAAHVPSPRLRRLPPGWRWTTLDEPRLDEHRALMLTLFRSLPGAYIPSLAELAESARGTAILVGDGRERAFASVRTEPGTTTGYVNAIGRAPELRGHGLGDHALNRALSLLRMRKAERVELEVVASNDAALALYRRHQFRVARETPVLRRQFSHKM
jgi:ribosomal protein S18 acetylase RimI-like enzyme